MKSIGDLLERILSDETRKTVNTTPRKIAEEFLTAKANTSESRSFYDFASKACRVTPIFPEYKVMTVRIDKI